MRNGRQLLPVILGLVLAVPSMAATVVSGDFNTDGRTDLALTGGSGWYTLPVASSNGDGTFTVTNAPVENFAGWAQVPGVTVSTGDFNTDGRTDLALTGGSGWFTMPVAFSNGDGTFNVTNAPVENFAGWAEVPVPVVDPGCEYRDDDADGLDDCFEDRALTDHAPILYMPLDYDWTMPANVDWYLARVELHFHHNNCGDDRVAGVGMVNQSNLLSFWHNGKEALKYGCDHTRSRFSTQTGPYRSGQHFFLQPPNDDVHAGSSNPGDWVVYGHAYPNTIGGVNLQYWFFYPYNDNASSFNHESDWEGMTVRLRADRTTVDGVYYCQHGRCSNLKLPSQVSWQNGHPTGWVADGSHATYVSYDECFLAPLIDEGGGPNCQWHQSYRWFTWTGGKGTQAGLQGWGVVNLGERDHPLNGQNFVDYSATWGEVGYTEWTSGKKTPSFQDDWNLDRQ